MCVQEPHKKFLAHNNSRVFTQPSLFLTVTRPYIATKSGYVGTKHIESILLYTDGYSTQMHILIRIYTL